MIKRIISIFLFLIVVLSIGLASVPVAEARSGFGSFGKGALLKKTAPKSFGFGKGLGRSLLSQKKSGLGFGGLSPRSSLSQKTGGLFGSRRNANGLLSGKLTKQQRPASGFNFGNNANPSKRTGWFNNHETAKSGFLTSNKNVQKLDSVNKKSTTSQALLPAPTHRPNAGGAIKSFATDKDETYYRVYSGDSKTGSFLTKTHPKNKNRAIEGLSLPDHNKADYIQEVTVPSGTRIQRSRALSAFGKRGGMEQFELIDKIPEKNFGNGVPFK